MKNSEFASESKVTSMGTLYTYVVFHCDISREVQAPAPTPDRGRLGRGGGATRVGRGEGGQRGSSPRLPVVGGAETPNTRPNGSGRNSQSQPRCRALTFLKF